MGVSLSAPRPIEEGDELTAFDCRIRVLDDWLKRRARANHVSGASRIYVVCESTRVIAYYALASGGVAIAEAPGRMRRNMPDPIPVMVLGRLAIDRGFQTRGLGRALVLDAARRVAQAADIIGIRGLLVHAVSEDAARFYLAVGFEPSPLEPMTLMATLADIRAAL